MSGGANGGRRWALFDALAAQRRFVYLAVAVLSATGVWAALRLPSAIYPELTFPRITIVAEGSSLSARQAVFGITRPIEDAVTIVPGVVRVKSRSIRGASEVNINFTEQTDMNYALQLVRTRVEQIRGELPPGLDIEVERLTPSLFPILSYNLEGGDPATLYDIARYQIKPVLSRIPGVGRVFVQGTDVREIEVVADPARLAQVGLTYDGLATAISEGIAVDAVGRVSRDYKQYLVVSAQEAHTAEDVANVVVKGALRVRDVATVVPGTEDHVRIVAGDGKPAALINVTRQIGGNTVAVADSVAIAARALGATLPPGVKLVPVYDQAALVRDAVTSVRDAMLIGAALAVIVLLLFLRHLRITAISATAIPLTLVATVWLMQLFGQTFNLMTVGSTITTVVVFLPLGALEGVAGQFFAALSLTLTMSVLMSLVIALTIIPLMADQFLTAADAEHEVAATGPLARIGAALDAMTERYVRVLDGALHHGRAMGIAALVLVALGIAAYAAAGTGFLPEMDEGAFIVDYWTPGGTALAETDRQIHIIEKILAETPEVESTARRTGAELGLFATEQNRGDISVRLKPPSEREREIEEIIGEVRKKVQAQVPRVRVEFVQILSDVLDDLSGSARPMEIKLFGADLRQLEAYAGVLAPKVKEVKGLDDFFGGVAEPAAEMEMHIRGRDAARYGITPRDVSSAVGGALLGVKAGEIRLDDRSIGIRVRAPDAIRLNAQRLAALPVLAGGGRAVTPLGALADFSAVDVRSQHLRENQQQMLAITGGVVGRPLSEVVGEVKKILDEHKPPSGVRVELGGRYASQQAAFRALLLVLALAAVSVMAVMVVQFRSFAEPFVVLLAAPLSFVGALALLLVTRTALNVSSFMGLILLVGLIVKNGIILLDFTKHRMRQAGVDLETGILEAARVRLRPILMTTLCTLFGLLPLALGIGAGSELQKPLALAVIGGLTLSTPVTLFLVPVLLVAIRGRGYRLPPDAPAATA
ncbi:MAG: efflux RND transporter permease subunit [Gemmatimonadetes bacterium]|nr:efflux RND transporter permease subunit [Gemmatimonadota bacterium]